MVRDHRVELDVGVFERLLYPQDVAQLLAHELLARPEEGTHLLRWSVRHELGRIKPCANKSEIHSPSLTSVLRPGTFLI